ncbi:helix-turn-helix domain-containing protein [Chryseolinea lacunae]|uniref:Helix-turn-helix domain-containing protein n=1 Tax=Chryseolinea lacunae TaxID=2801331 RepID=A0ABS1KZ50_9BACT|nr:helix-turn-helix domain-containing protein [Chryseolinea lacunae]MBL0744738.1 helix-turn-helix domain-containing protein [Chryseolinea lacunae]
MGARESISEFIEQAKTDQQLASQVRALKFDPSAKTTVMPYSRRDYYKIWVTVGTSRLHYATHTVEIPERALIFSNPRVPYSFESDGRNSGYMCIFMEEFVKGMRTESLQDSPLFKIGAKPVFFLDDHRYAVVSDLYEKILAELETTYVYRYEVIRNYINLIIHEGLKMEPALSAVKHHSASSRIASLFLELLERQFPIDSPRHALTMKKASDFATSLSVHVNHLNHAVREITGKSTTTHIADRVVAEARALLLHSDLSISEIAYCLGFEYPNYFNNFFKKNTGTTPMTLRK